MFDHISKMFSLIPRLSSQAARKFTGISKNKIEDRNSASKKGKNAREEGRGVQF